MQDFNVLVAEITKIIKQIDLTKIHPLFRLQPLAIYHEGKLYFADETKDFSNGDYKEQINREVAVLNSDDLNDDLTISVGLFVKQMFYNFFYDQQPNRVPNDLLALDYPQSYLNYDYMRYERQLLAKASLTTDKYLKLNYFRMFLNVRDLRFQMIGSEYSNLEYQLETMDGLAQFVMYKTIGMIDKKKMKQRLKYLMSIFNVANRNYFDFRRGNMYSGLLICIVLDDLQYDLSILYDLEETLYQYAVKNVAFYRENIMFKSDRMLLENWNQYLDDVKDKFTKYFDYEPKKVTGTFQIYAFDPERIFKEKGNIYHESFVVLKNLATNELIYLNGPIITKVLENSVDIVTTYYLIGGRKHAR